MVDRAGGANVWTSRRFTRRLLDVSDKRSSVDELVVGSSAGGRGTERVVADRRASVGAVGARESVLLVTERGGVGTLWAVRCELDVPPRITRVAGAFWFGSRIGALTDMRLPLLVPVRW